eukprot:superscaffoldBa00000014_g273
MLQTIRTLDPERKNLVRFIDNFKFQGLSSLAFELLGKSLWDLMKEREWMPLTHNEIRPVTRQLIVAFEALKGIGIIHTDLKPDNIMLVNHKDQHFRVKLIDFGLALPVSKVQIGMTVQACGYRAPEVTLDLPISEAIDMWGLGCVIAFLFFGTKLFPGECEYHWMKVICQLLGQPGDHLLSAGKNTRHYFSKQQGSINSEWRLDSPDEYKEATAYTDTGTYVDASLYEMIISQVDALDIEPITGSNAEVSDTDSYTYEVHPSFLFFTFSGMGLQSPAMKA